MAEAIDVNISGLKISTSSSAIKGKSHTEKMSPLAILIKACEKGSPREVVKALTSCKKNVDDVLETGSAPIGWTCLLYASRNLNREVMEFLLENGADPDVCSPSGFSPIMAVAMASSPSTQTRAVSCARLLVGSDVSVRNAYTGTRRTLLTRAVINGAYELVDYLISVGADPNEHDGFGETPLNIAIVWNLKAIALHLVNSGASPYIDNDNGESCLDLAVKLNKGDEMETLVVQWRMDYYQKHHGDDPRFLRKLLQKKKASPCLSISTSYESLASNGEVPHEETGSENKRNENAEDLGQMDEAAAGNKDKDKIAADEAGDNEVENAEPIEETRNGNGGKWFLAGMGIAAAMLCMIKGARFSK